MKRKRGDTVSPLIDAWGGRGSKEDAQTRVEDNKGLTTCWNDPVLLFLGMGKDKIVLTHLFDETPLDVPLLCSRPSYGLDDEPHESLVVPEFLEFLNKRHLWVPPFKNIYIITYLSYLVKYSIEKGGDSCKIYFV